MPGIQISRFNPIEVGFHRPLSACCNIPGKIIFMFILFIIHRTNTNEKDLMYGCLLEGIRTTAWMRMKFATDVEHCLEKHIA